MSETPHVEITLSPVGVANAARWTAALASEAVGTCLRALESDDHSPPNMPGGSFNYRFGDLGLSNDERRTAFRNWILCNGFKDLTRGIRACLEEAVQYLRFLEWPEGATTLRKIQAEKNRVISAAQRMNFPTLLERVNGRLQEKLDFESEFRSLQAARNCLEHRYGFVSDQDVNSATGKLVLVFPRLETFFSLNGVEVEMWPGKTVKDHFAGHDLTDDTDVPLMMRRTSREIAFEVGDQLTVSAMDFYEISMACNFFAADLSSKLPTKAKLSI